MLEKVREKLPDVDLMAMLDSVVSDAVASLKRRQREDGHWVNELEADVTIPAEYILLGHFLDDVDEELEARLSDYVRSVQEDHGGWPLFHRGNLDLSASVKAYYALKLAGDDVDAPHMARAREAILAAGGAEKANVFTRYALALFGQVPWRAVPVMPVQLMLMPKWFPVTMWRFSYWSRTVIAPLLVLAALKPKARNPKGIDCAELFNTPPFEIKDYMKDRAGKFWSNFFISLDKVLRFAEPHFPKGSRDRAMKAAVDYFEERLNGEDGLGAIFPAMANSVMAMDAMGYERDDPRFATAYRSVKKLLVTGENGKTYCQPCVSPIWDTALAGHALLEAGEDGAGETMAAASNWLKEKQITDVVGDWAVKAPDLRPGGWAFQYENAHFPDVDDTAVVGMMLDRVAANSNDAAHKESIDRAAEWIIGMQSKNGGWGAFDIDNDNTYLNCIPFADHGAILDPPTEDVTARCISFLAQIGYDADHPVMKRGIAYLEDTQEEDGSWFGRWGTNYIYGTWSVLCALNAAGIDPDAPMMRRAVDFLVARQRADGGWGEDGSSYDGGETRDAAKASTPSQAAWAVLGLMAAGEVDHAATRRGIEYLVKAPRDGDKWEEPWFTAVGFPRVFYLRYDGYSRFFPVWALARYKNLKQSNSREVPFGM